VPILVVDDDPDIRDIVSQLLEDEGYTVVEAADGREALVYLQMAPALPCLIILDLMMPIMHGWDVLQARQNDPRLASMPIAVLSAYYTIISAAVLHVQAIVAKPFELERLLAVVQRYCPMEAAS
jgi:CheY-like chemotaxis protein